MQHLKTFQRKKIVALMTIIIIMAVALTGRLIYLMVFRSVYYEQTAQDLHERERSIKAARGKIVDRNGIVLADNKSVCTISVIHSQIEDPERVIEVLQKELAHTSDEKMKSIISTIQREQNVIIRNEKANTLIIQGVAGSGKTSIALHRIAFLLYRFKNQITAENVAIVSPNRVCCFEQKLSFYV